MANAIKHRKRSHRSEKTHWRCLHQMKQFSPAGGFDQLIGTGTGRRIPEKKAGPMSFRLLHKISKHARGWGKQRDRKRTNGNEVTA